MSIQDRAAGAYRASRTEREEIARRRNEVLVQKTIRQMVTLINEMLKPVVVVTPAHAKYDRDGTPYITVEDGLDISAITLPRPGAPNEVVLVVRYRCVQYLCPTYTYHRFSSLEELGQYVIMYGDGADSMKCGVHQLSAGERATDAGTESAVEAPEMTLAERLRDDLARAVLNIVTVEILGGSIDVEDPPQEKSGA